MLVKCNPLFVKQFCYLIMRVYKKIAMQKANLIYCLQSGQNQAPVGADDKCTHEKWNHPYLQVGESQSTIFPVSPLRQ